MLLSHHSAFRVADRHFKFLSPFVGTLQWRRRRRYGPVSATYCGALAVRLPPAADPADAAGAAAAAPPACSVSDRSMVAASACFCFSATHSDSIAARTSGALPRLLYTESSVLSMSACVPTLGRSVSCFSRVAPPSRFHTICCAASPMRAHTPAKGDAALPADLAVAAEGVAFAAGACGAAEDKRSAGLTADSAALLAQGLSW